MSTMIAISGLFPLGRSLLRTRSEAPHDLEVVAVDYPAVRRAASRHEEWSIA